ncbi:structural protein [Nitrospirillum sp. BR 11163]|uniref:structural protein n=1 Tax=Nitrospirillum sp. BR 11163 TaxID=3104323 RepID=UPI002AFF67EA|nr:structural protein [Nitrospirillum sp. BR 11163]MEA1674116.1 structural protein [Nitrospirillum sp. BR 11163]
MNAIPQKVPRGIRNNNPCNIRKSPTVWNGQAADQNDAAFVVFRAPEFGLRAAMKIIRNYGAKYGLDTVSKVISRWAPDNENDTGAYIAHVARCMKVGADDGLDMSDADTLLSIVRAMTSQENGPAPADRGGDWYPDVTYQTARRLYLAA